MSFLPSNQNNRKFVDQMKNDDAVKLGVNLNIANCIVAEMVSYYGYDFIMVDFQHSAYNRESLASMFQAIKLGGAKSIIRVEGPNDRYGIQQALDLGVDGILVPYVNNKEEVETAISYMMYPGHEGKEGTRSLYLNIRKTLKAGGGGMGMMVQHYDTNKDIIIACQIETASALANIEEICSIPQLDICFIGPGDLASSMGLLHSKGFDAFGDPAFIAAQDTVVAACKKHGKVPGMWGSMDIEGCLAKGFRFVMAGSDSEYLRSAMEQQRTTLMETLKNWKPRNAPADPSDV